MGPQALRKIVIISIIEKIFSIVKDINRTSLG